MARAFVECTEHSVRSGAHDYTDDCDELHLAGDDESCSIFVSEAGVHSFRRLEEEETYEKAESDVISCRLRSPSFGPSEADEVSVSLQALCSGSVSPDIIFEQVCTELENCTYELVSDDDCATRDQAVSATKAPAKAGPAAGEQMTAESDKLFREHALLGIANMGNASISDNGQLRCDSVLVRDKLPTDSPRVLDSLTSTAVGSWQPDPDASLATSFASSASSSFCLASSAVADPPEPHQSLPFSSEMASTKACVDRAVAAQERSSSQRDRAHPLLEDIDLEEGAAAYSTARAPIEGEGLRRPLTCRRAAPVLVLATVAGVALLALLYMSG